MTTISSIRRYGLMCVFYMALVGMANAQLEHPDLVVAADGSGDYKNVQDAINAVPQNSPTRTVIFIKPGTYKEKIRVPSDKKKLKLMGESYENTILTFDDHAGKTKDYASTRIYADDFFAEQITFQNTIDSRKGGAQAAAVRLDADRAVFYQCRITGYQDTYYTGGNKRSYHKDCIIEGTTDFIYGDGIALFEDCTINNHGPLCAVYPHEGMGCTGVCEGDSPTFLYLVSANRGINDPEDPTQPSWGGQYKRKANTTHYIDGPGGSSISKWRKDFQKEFAERADWCVSQ